MKPKIVLGFVMMMVGAAIAGVAIGHGSGNSKVSACASAQANAQQAAVAQGATNVKALSNCECSSDAGGTIWECTAQATY